MPGQGHGFWEETLYMNNVLSYWLNRAQIQLETGMRYNYDHFGPIKIWDQNVKIQEILISYTKTAANRDKK